MDTQEITLTNNQDFTQVINEDTDISPLDVQLGEQLGWMLDDAGIRQKYFCDALGWKPDNLSQKINGKRTWKVGHIHRLCQVLGIMVVIDGYAMEIRNTEQAAPKYDTVSVYRALQCVNPITP